MTGPDWNGEKPPGIDAMIPSETDIVLIINRTQIFGPDDLQNVADIQDAYDTQPLSTFPGGPEIDTEGPDSPPVWGEGAQFGTRSFAYLDYLLSQIEPANGEEDLRQRFAEIGIGTKDPFDLGAFPTDEQAAFSQGIEDATTKIQNIIDEKATDQAYVNGIFGTRDFLRESAKALGEESYYILRAVGAFTGLFGNTATEAMYSTYFTDGDGTPVDASAAVYTITFAADELPPVKSVWSLKMYDGATQLLIDNPPDR